MRDTLGFSLRLGRAIGTPLEVRRDTLVPFLVATEILGFLSIFKWSQASYPFEALTPAFLSSFHRYIGVPVEMRREPSAFSRVCTGDSYIHSSFEIKHDPAFKSRQGNPALFSVRSSRLSLPLEAANSAFLSHT